MANVSFRLSPFAFRLSLARKAGIEPTLTVLETALLPLEDFRSSGQTCETETRYARLTRRCPSSQINEQMRSLIW